jgi:hypothetical protein
MPPGVLYLRGLDGSPNQTTRFWDDLRQFARGDPTADDSDGTAYDALDSDGVAHPYQIQGANLRCQCLREFQTDPKPDLPILKFQGRKSDPDLAQPNCLQDHTSEKIFSTG